MKNRLLTVAACAMVAAVGSPSFAGNWDKPQVPKGEAPVSKSQYYIYNVAAEKFLVSGSSWKTRATLGDKGLLVELTDSVHTPLAGASYNTVALQGWTIKVKDTFKNWVGNDLTNTYVFVHSETEAYCDMASQGKNFFKFVPWGDNYRIKIADEDPTFGASVNDGQYAYSYFAYMPNAEEVDENGTAAPHLYPVVDELDVSSAKDMEWRFISKSSYETYLAKTMLYEKLNQAEEQGNVETAEAEAVYNNEASTIADYEAACVALQRKILEVYAADATFDAPIALTDMVVQTPQPGNDGKAGWVQTNHGGFAKSGKHYNWSNLEDGVDVFGPNFLEYWVVSPNILTNDTLYQVIESLPYGVYRLTADAIAIQQAEPGTEVVGVSLFADGGALTKKALWSKVNHTPHRYSIEFAVMQDQTTIGMMIENTNANHAAITNFKLEVLTASDNPLVALLFSEINKAESVDPKAATFSLATEILLKKVVQEAKDLIDGGTATDDELKVKIEELTGVLATVQQEIEKYVWVDNYVGKVLPDLKNKYANEYPELGTALNEYAVQLQNALNGRTLSIADIDAVEAAVDKIIKDGIRAEIGVGKEVTGLLVNPDFDNGRDGWTLNSGSIGNSNFKACEAYGEKFDLSQTLKDMPNGRYKVTCQAFYRPKAAGDAWNDYAEQNGDADVRLFLYGNSMQKAVQHEFDGRSTDKLAEGDVYVSINDIYYYFPNNINGITNYFAAGHYQNELEFVVADGTLTIGLRVLEPIVDTWNNWSAFDNFHLYYVGDQVSDYRNAILALQAEAQDLQDSGYPEDGTVLTAGATNKIADAIARSNAALEDGATVEQCVEAVNALNEAIAYGKESQRLTQELLSAYMVYYTRCEGVQNATSEDFLILLDEIDMVFQTDGVFESNKQVQEYLDRLAPEFTAYAISGGIGTATVDNPHDITAVILNPGFDWDYSDSNYGWTGSPAVQANVAEYYNAYSFDCNQKIVGLVPGYYRLSVDGFYRAGSAENSTKLYYKELYAGDTSVEGDEENFPYLYAAEGKKYLKNMSAYSSTMQVYDDDVNIGAWMSKAEEPAAAYVPNTRFGCNYYFMLKDAPYRNSLIFQVTEEMDTVTIGIKKENARIYSEWCPFDNFKLEYVGADASQTADLRISNAGFATLMLPYDAALPEGVKAYSTSQAAEATANGCRVLKLVEEDALQANTPYIIEGMPGTYTFSGLVTNTQDTYTNGWLTGTFVARQAQAGTYVLQNNNGITGFYRVVAGKEPQVGANRAWLSVPTEEGGAAEVTAFVFGDDSATGIEGVEAADRRVDVYTLEGVRVRTDVRMSEALKALPRGVYVVNGTKKAVK